MPGYDAAAGHQLVEEIGGRRSRLIQQIDIERARKLRLQLVAAEDDAAKRRVAAELGKLKGDAQVRIELANWYSRRSAPAAGRASTWKCSGRSALASPRASGATSKPSATTRRPRSSKPATSASAPRPSRRSTSPATRAPRQAWPGGTVAGERIVATDARYTRVELRRGPYGWDLLVVRRRGGQQLEEARRIRATTRAAGLAAV